jgi:hypothetical protein
VAVWALATESSAANEATVKNNVASDFFT